MIAAAPRGVLRLDAADLVATAGAASTLAELDGALAEAGAWLALDPPGAATRSLGAALGAGAGGPLSALFGPPRDQVIGLTFIAGNGTMVKTGGRVVKNVAGFDLAKLVIGGHGAFGFITEAHLRLRARPAADVTRAWAGGEAGIAAGTAALMQGGAMLASLEVVSPALAAALGLGPRWAVLARAMGTEAGVGEELAAAAGALHGAATEVAAPGDGWAGWRAAVGDWPACARIGADPDAWRDAVALASRFGADAFSATIPRGTIRARFPAGSADSLGGVRAAAAARGWPVTIERAEPGVLDAVGIWGAMDEGARTVAERLRAALGPEGTHRIPLWR